MLQPRVVGGDAVSASQLIQPGSALGELVKSCCADLRVVGLAIASSAAAAAAREDLEGEAGDEAGAAPGLLAPVLTVCAFDAVGASFCLWANR